MENCEKGSDGEEMWVRKRERQNEKEGILKS